jgi:hypothetical protein
MWSSDDVPETSCETATEISDAILCQKRRALGSDVHCNACVLVLRVLTSSQNWRASSLDICKGYLSPGLRPTYGEVVAWYTEMTKKNATSRRELIILHLQQERDAVLITETAFRIFSSPNCVCNWISLCSRGLLEKLIVPHTLPVLEGPFRDPVQHLVTSSIIFWVMASCSPSGFNRRFGRTYRLHLQGRINKFGKNQQASWFLLNLFIRPWRWRRYVPPKRRLKLGGIHGAISQKMILFITTAVKTSNPT